MNTFYLSLSQKYTNWANEAGVDSAYADKSGSWLVETENKAHFALCTYIIEQSWAKQGSLISKVL